MLEIEECARLLHEKFNKEKKKKRKLTLLFTFTIEIVLGSSIKNSNFFVIFFKISRLKFCQLTLLNY